MTEIDFYSNCGEPVWVATRICHKAFAGGRRVRILTADPAMTESVDQLMWRNPAIGFLPHCRIHHRLAGETPVWVDERPEHDGPADVLINLGVTPPPFFSRFERLVEIVGRDEAGRGAGRDRYRFYRERGYTLRNHDMSGT